MRLYLMARPIQAPIINIVDSEDNIIYVGNPWYSELYSTISMLFDKYGYMDIILFGPDCFAKRIEERLKEEFNMINIEYADSAEKVYEEEDANA